MKPLESTIAVNGYQLAAQEWHPDAPIKVIALHGWLDNAASFSRIAPLMTHCHILALDLAGHGLSDHKPHQATYNVWDDLLDILAVADHQDWSHFHLLGHSRGAMVSLLLAATMPERVRSLVLLDGILPSPVSAGDSVKQLGQFLRDSRKPSKKSHSGYESMAKAVQVRCKATGMSEESVWPLVKRAVVELDECYYWRPDPRLTNASAFKLTAAHNQAFIDALQAPNLILLIDNGLVRDEYFRSLLEVNPKLHYELVVGSHHFHLEAGAEEIAQRIGNFYLQHAGLN